MPNLKQLSKLKEIYGDSVFSNFRKSDIDILLESFQPEKLVKGFENLLITKSFSFQDFNAFHYIDYFLNRKKVEAVLLFIDITLFSKKFHKKTTEQIVAYLDEYYKYIIPVINKHGGEIEKIMGDGIICVFGEPFLDRNQEELHKSADKCSREIISTLRNTEFAVKIALHYGEIMYYKNPTSEYYEFTMIGSAVTELFRLEGVSTGDSINYFAGTKYDYQIEAGIDRFDTQFARFSAKIKYRWMVKTDKYYDLQGTDYGIVKRVEFVG